MVASKLGGRFGELVACVCANDKRAAHLETFLPAASLA